MKRIFACALSLACLISFAAGVNPRREYIARYSKIAVAEMKRTGVPASITLAQGILESNSGQSALAREANNHFGIKCHKDWTGKVVRKDAEVARECFRAYPTAEASFRDHSDFLRYQNRYKSLFSLRKTDYKAWAHGLKKAGYATDPAYPQKLIKIIEDCELYKFDKGVVVEAPAPLEVETPKVVPVDDVIYREQVSVSLSREIYSQNGVPFVYAHSGETYESLASRFNLFKKEILRFNDLSVSEPLEEGTVVYLKTKKNRAAAGLDKYVVDEGESVSLRDISQRYGVRLSALQKLNPFAAGILLDSGDTILLR